VPCGDSEPAVMIHLLFVFVAMFNVMLVDIIIFG
jgi:hypothetical protein